MITVRVAVPSDAEAVANIHVRTWQYAYRGILPDEYLDGLSVEKRLAQRLRILDNQAPPYRTIVAEVDGAIAGFCDLGPNRDEAETGEILALYVAPGSARTGVGTALMEKALETFRTHGLRRATLWVLTDNTLARRFYEKTGWTTDGTTHTENQGTFILEEILYSTRLE